MARKKKVKRKARRKTASFDSTTNQMIKTTGNLMGGMMAMGMASQMMGLVKK